MILGLVGVIIIFYTRKMKENKKPVFIVSIQYISMALVIILGGYSQYQSSQEDKKYKQATLEVSVLSKVSEYFLPVINNMAKIQNEILVVKNYLSFEKAKKEHPELAVAINWQKEAGALRVAELNKAKESFENIKSIAAEIIKANIQYENIIPKETIEWANFTLNIEFEEIEKYFDPYAPIGGMPNKSVLMYQENTGKAFGLVIGKIRAASNVLKQY